MSFDHKQVDAKWQQRWEESQIFAAQNDSKQKKFYVLVEFPYPSGAGLHVGHPRSYTALDVVARKKRMEGQNVLFPMGWDAFGLPAEAYAIKTGVHPAITTKQNIDTFRRQLKSIGFSFDWSREINTTNPKYYRWTQWMFNQFFKAGLAYKAKAKINWCPKDKIGLANEEVVGGACERCGTPVEKREKEQWMIAITKYADQLLADLDTVDYLPKIRKQQEDWIGRREGMTFTHQVKDLTLKLDSFTAYPAWSFADTYLVISPDHPDVPALIQGTAAESKFADFLSQCRQLQASESANLDKLGLDTGRVAIDPLTGNDMPIWLANFATMDFGTGVIRCSAHDERDVEFANKYGLILKEVVDRVNADQPVSAHDNQGVLKDSGPFSGRNIDSQLIEEMNDWFVNQGYGERKISYRLRDWVFSRQRYWGEPIPLVRCDKDGWVAVPDNQLPVELPQVEKYEPTDNGESPLANITDWVNTTCPTCGGAATRETDTMPNWAGSSWYFLRYIDPHNDEAFASKDSLKYWMPVDLYNGGMEHTTLHLLYSRFWNKFLFNQGLVPTSEPYSRRYSHGLIMAEDGTKMSKSKGNVVNPDDVINEFGADTLRTYLLFMGPFEEPVPWSTNGLIGVRRFLDKVIKASDKLIEQEAEVVTRSLHKTIKKVSDDIEAFRFNTAVSEMMKFVNTIEEQNGISSASFSSFLTLLSPFAPHLTNELWEKLGNQELIEKQTWPEVDADLLIDDVVTIVVQVNGKVRANLVVPADITDEDLIAQAKADSNVQKFLNSEPKKQVVVKGKLVNFVV